MRVAREGWPVIGVAAVVLGTAAGAMFWLWPLGAVVPVALWLGVVGFFRDPRRVPPGGCDVLLAPADGRITGVSRGPENTLTFSIFLSLFDVHINRTPCAGIVRDVVYRPGAFRNALRESARRSNACNTVVLDPNPPLPAPVEVTQIAGVLARRIVCHLEPGQVVSAGERFGMIRFGSRTDVTVPQADRWEVCVRRGQHVRAGVSILARLTEQPSEALAGSVEQQTPEPALTP